MSDWGIGDCIWCYKEYLSLVPCRKYIIVGSVDLSIKADPNVGVKTGYGYYVEITEKNNREFIYFTEYEMDKYFVKNYTDIKSVIRDNKINEILKND
jgi:hypothetical protein